MPQLYELVGELEHTPAYYKDLCKHYAEEAETSAQNASTSEQNASASEQNASASAQTATDQAGIATTQAGLASASALSASGYATTAGQKANEASTSAINAEKWASYTNGTVDGTNYSAKQYALNAGNSATTASTKAGEASDSAQTASDKAGIATTQAGLASGSALSASNSATLAENWATKTDGTVDGTNYSAKKYAENAQTSATNAGTSETNAGNSATLAEKWATLMGDTVDGNEYSAKYYANESANSATSASNSASSAQSYADYIEDEAVKIDTTEKRVSNIEKLLQGNLYDYQTDSTSAYTKTVPNGAMPYASLEQIGGKTLVWNQLNDNANASKTSGNLTIIKDADNGTWTANGTEEAITTYNISSAINYIAGHKYLLMGCPSGGSGTTFSLTATNLGATDNGDGTIVTCSTSNSGYMRIVIRGGYVASNLVFRPLLFDLTLCYGAGNEPTLAEFQQTFPAQYYSYNAGTLLSAGVTEVVSVGKNLVNISDVTVTTQTTLGTVSLPIGTYTASFIATNNTAITGTVRYRANSISGTLLANINIASSVSNAHLNTTFTLTEPTDIYIVASGASAGYSYLLKAIQIEVGSTATDYAPYVGTIATYPIPAEIRNLEGYGWSVGSVYNYIDYENKKFVQRVASVDLGTLSWISYATDTEGYSRFLSASINTVAKKDGNILCAKYMSVPYADTTHRINGINLFTNGNVIIYDDAYATSTAPQFTTAMSGVYAYYELDTPQEIDISAYLTDDNLISVESGGTLTFPNQNGDDYRIDVPSAETYMVDLQASL